MIFEPNRHDDLSGGRDLDRIWRGSSGQDLERDLDLEQDLERIWRPDLRRSRQIWRDLEKDLEKDSGEIWQDLGEDPGEIQEDLEILERSGERSGRDLEGIGGIWEGFGRGFGRSNGSVNVKETWVRVDNYDYVIKISFKTNGDILVGFTDSDDHCFGSYLDISLFLRL